MRLGGELTFSTESLEEIVDKRAAGHRDFMRRLAAGLEIFGVPHRAPASLVAPPRTGLLFTNSVVVPFFNDLVSGKLTEASFSLQPCLRAHNLQMWDRGIYSGEWLCAFTMAGAFATTLDATVELSNRLIREVPRRPGTSLLISSAVRDNDMARALASALDADTRPVLVFEEAAPDHQVSWKPDYHDWSFGRRPLTGQGLTIALVDDDGFRRDLGNLIEFSASGRPIAYGIGLGVETMLAASLRTERLVDCLPEGALMPNHLKEGVAWIDFLAGLVAAVAAGATPGARGPGAIVRKMATRIRALTFQQHLTERYLTDVTTLLANTRLQQGLEFSHLSVDHVTECVIQEIYAPKVADRHQFTFTIIGPASAVAEVTAAAVDSPPAGGDTWVIESIKSAHPPGETAERQSLSVEVTSMSSDKRTVHGKVSAWMLTLAVSHQCDVKGFGHA